MEYLPSYMDDLYLEHHGILGQKWGVRRYQNEDGTRTDAGKKRYNGTSNYNRIRKNLAGGGPAIGSSARVRQKQQMMENKIKKSGDKNFLTRNLVNDYRRGRAAALNAKATHREAKEAYARNKTKANRDALRTARIDRLVRNGLSTQVGIGAITRGKYNRYRQAGDNVTTALLKTYGATANPYVGLGYAITGGYSR